MRTNPIIQVQQVSQRFNTSSGEFLALDNVSFDIHPGETLSLIGHSGCGKSTLLNLIAGLTLPTSGGLLCNNREMEMHEWIMHNLDLVHMSHAWNKRPHEISGGMKQRVGIARALAMKPSVLLMDEPFGALDALTRAHLQDAVMEIQQRLHTTIVLITHDVDEAVLLSDRVLMMTNGPAASIGEIMAVELERTRSRVSLADDAQYQRYRQQVLHFLYEKQPKAA